MTKKKGPLPEYSFFRGILKFIVITLLIGLVIAVFSFGLSKLLGKSLQGLTITNKTTVSGMRLPQITTPLFGSLAEGVAEDYILYAEGDDKALMEMIQKDSSLSNLLKNMNLQKEASPAQISAVFMDKGGLGIITKDFDKTKWEALFATMTELGTPLDGWYYAVIDSNFVVTTHPDLVTKVTLTLKKQLLGLDLDPAFTSATKSLPHEGTLLLALPYHGKMLDRGKEVESMLTLSDLLSSHHYYVFTQEDNRLRIEGK